jgi:hypothetical protein
MTVIDKIQVQSVSISLISHSLASSIKLSPVISTEAHCSVRPPHQIPDFTMGYFLLPAIPFVYQAVVGLVAAGGLAGGSWYVFRDRPEPPQIIYQEIVTVAQHQQSNETKPWVGAVKAWTGQDDLFTLGQVIAHTGPFTIAATLALDRTIAGNDWSYATQTYQPAKETFRDMVAYIENQDNVHLLSAWKEHQDHKRIYDKMVTAWKAYQTEMDKGPERRRVN